jgi:hypothetical protein
MLMFSALAAAITRAVAVEWRADGSLARLRMIVAVSGGGIYGLMSAGDVGVP